MQLSIFKCIRCKNHIKKEDLRYDLEGKNYMCKQCLHQVITYYNAKDLRDKEVPMVITSDKIRLICYDCRYKFSVGKDSRLATVCPYCAGHKLLKDEFSIEKVLKDAGNKLHDY